MNVSLAGLRFSLLLVIVAACHAQSPLLIAWQAPPPPPLTQNSWSLGFNGNTDMQTGICNGKTQYDCFTADVLPNISGIGVVVPWGELDKCGPTTSCVADDTCGGSTCFNWGWLDTPLMAYINNTNIGGKTWAKGCAGGRPCKIALIVWLTADTGNANLYVGLPNQFTQGNQVANTPPYVFTQNWANQAGWANPASGCTSPNDCAPQDVMACQQHQGSGQTDTTGWGSALSPMYESFGGSCVGDVGLWNTQGTNILRGADVSQGGCWTRRGITLNFSGYPVMYENPVYYAARNLIRALSIHYSPTCNYSSCGNGPLIAQSIAYMRIGPSGGGENYPDCACSSSSGGAQCNTFFWPGPNGYDGGQHTYSDQGYLTTWTGNNDASGYIASLYSYMHSLSWAFPIDSPMEHGPPQDLNYTYPDTEAFLANQSGLGMGMQALNIGDLVTYAANSYSYFSPSLSFFPSTVENWAVNFREYPNVPVHHLQTEQPGSPTAARFTVGGLGITISSTGCTASSCPQATIHCSTYAVGDCSAFCTVAPWVYVDQSANAALNGIQRVNVAPGNQNCDANTINLIGSFPPPGGASYSGGYVYSGVHLPALLPFVTQQCQGAAQTICSVEIWEEILDWAYGTVTISNGIGDTGPGDSTYQTAIQNYLVGLPNATSFHNNMSTNASHY